MNKPELTLEQVRDRLRSESGLIERDSHKYPECAYRTSAYVLDDLADAIDAELKARGEPVAEVMDELGFPIMTWLPTNVIDWPVGTKLYTAPPTPKIEVTDAMVERACKKYAFREDGATFPDAYSDEEVLAERVLMREFLEHVLLAAQENPNG